MPDAYYDDQWDEDVFVITGSLRVHWWRGAWYCTCSRFSQAGRCPHVVPYLPKEDVDVSEDYL